MLSDLKIPPQSIESEISVLGAMLLDKGAIYKAVEILTEDAFYKITHRKIYSAILDLFERNEPVDLVTLTNELKKKGELGNIGGPLYLTTILNSVPTADNVEYYAKEVEEKYIQRQLLVVSKEIEAKVFEQNIENIDRINFCKSRIDEIIENLGTKNFINIDGLLFDQFDEIDKLQEFVRKGKLRGIPSGYTEIDKKTGGFKEQNFIVVAGRPSMGKSALVLNFLYNMMKSGISVGLFSIESGKSSIMKRLLSMGSKVDLMAITTGYLRDEHYAKLTIEAGNISEIVKRTPFFINDTPNINLTDLEITAYKMVKCGVKIIVIDYLQLVTAGKAETREREIAMISARLKGLARKLNIPIIAVSQLSRAVEYRSEKRPTLADLRESGAIEQDADIVFLLYRDDYYHTNSKDEGIIEVNIAKHREGITGVEKLTFIKSYLRFENLYLSEES